jgi:phosphoglycerate dehydrogenase-like enzyme
MIHVAILDDYQKVALGLGDWSGLAVAAPQVFEDHLADEDALVERLIGFEIIVAMRERTPFPRSLLSRLPHLRLLVTTGLRNASIDLAAAAELGVVVSGTRGLPYPTAELTWGLILGLCRNIPLEDRATRVGEWQVSLGVGVRGKTLGLVGLGNLGSQVAAIGKAFGMDVVAWSQNLSHERAAEVGVRRAETLLELLAGADIVSVHLVLGERTRGLLGARELAAMKRTAFLVNTARGPIVDEAALVQALRARAIAGAGLDVFETEPLPPDHALRSLPNTIITPHLGYVTEETYRLFFGDAVEDIRAYLAGHPLRVLPPP